MLKKGWIFFVRFAMKLYSVAMRSVSFYTSFLICRGCIWIIALILSRLALIPLVESKQPNTLPQVTLKMHYSELSFRLASRMLVKVSARSEMYDSFFLLATMMSSM
jgi:hypothetical protein